jgi:hypothetical protein
VALDNGGLPVFWFGSGALRGIFSIGLGCMPPRMLHYGLNYVNYFPMSWMTSNQSVMINGCSDYKNTKSNLMLD